MAPYVRALLPARSCALFTGLISLGHHTQMKMSQEAEEGTAYRQPDSRAQNKYRTYMRKALCALKENMNQKKHF